MNTLNRQNPGRGGFIPRARISLADRLAGCAASGVARIDNEIRGRVILLGSRKASGFEGFRRNP